MWGAVDTLYDLIYFVLRNLKDFRWEALIGYSLYLFGKRSGMKMFRRFMVTHFKYLEDEDSQWRYYVNKQAHKLRRGEVHPKKAVCWQWEAIKETGSEELNYIIDIITGGRRPGKKVPDEDSNT